MNLLPCPFCGGVDVHLVPTGIGAPLRWCVICYGCHTEGPVDLGESGAVEQWNTRTPPPPPALPSHDELYAIIEQHTMVTDAWGGSQLANWKYGYDVMVGGIDEAVDAIMAAITPAPPPPDAPDAAKVADCDGNTVTQ